MTEASLGHAGNVLGAVALAVTDRMGGARAAPGLRSEAAASAVSALAQFLDRPSIDRLAQVIGLSHSGTVRLVDRLEQQGLVRRDTGEDARSVAVALTPAGRRAAGRLRAARAAVLEGLLEPLSTEERRQLDALLGRLAATMVREPCARRWTCRLCDLGACGRAAGRCPIERAAHRRDG